MVSLEFNQVYGLLSKDLEVKQHYGPLTRCMIMFSFMSCTAVSTSQLFIGLGVFAGFHAYLILTDTSTLDVLRGETRRSISAANWYKVFGRRPLEWCLPCSLSAPTKLG
jgi:hypothetical protein